MQYEIGCTTCGVEVYTRLLKRYIRNTNTGVECVTFICQKCAAKLHFGSLVGYEKYIPKDQIVVEGKKFQVKKGRIE